MIKLRRGIGRVLLLILLVGAAVPTISGITGAVTHGQSITITGTGFGTKAVVAPQVWDDASGADGNSALLDKWDGTSPNLSITTDKRIARRNAHRGVSPPHARTGRYITGCHDIEDFDTNNYNLQKGGVVSVWKAMTATFPMDIYQSAWARFDPLWVAPDSGTQNNKMLHLAYSNTPSTYPGHGQQDHLTFDYSADAFPFDSSSAAIKLKSYADLVGTMHYGGINTCFNYISGWGKVEVVIRIASPSGYFRWYENGRLTYSRNIDFPAPTTSFVTTNFGDFARPYRNDIFWRYFTDCYIDNSFQRVILGNAPTLNSSCTVREVQIPTAWADTSVTVTVNRGVFADDDPVYLFVVDSADVASSGFPIEAAPVEAPPVITSALSVFAEVGAGEPYQIGATNNPTSYTASPLPSGRTLNPSTGEITGTYSQVGFTQTVATATNAFGTDQETVSFDVSQAAVAGIEDPVMIGTAANKVGSTLSVTVQQIVPVGNTIFVWLSCNGGTATTGLPTCRDTINGPNDYARDVFNQNGDGSRKAALFRFSNNSELPAGSVITVTIGDSIVGEKTMTAWWVRGLNMFDPLDVSNSEFSDISTTTPDSGPITTT